VSPHAIDATISTQATMLKDLGKVHGFLASIFGGSEATSRQFLAEALRIQQRLDRPAECETENIQRLMRDRPNNLADLEAGDILTLDGDQIDVVLHDVAEQQQNQPDDDDDDDDDT
jgi:hypothetical protein